MKLILSCVCCGNTDFLNIIELEYREEKEQRYLFNENEMQEKAICTRCELEDYIGNLIPKIVNF